MIIEQTIERASGALARAMASSNQVEVLRALGGEDRHPSEILRTRSQPGHRLGELYPWMLNRDTHLAAVVAKWVDLVLSLPTSIEPASPSTPEAEETAEFCRFALAQIPDFRLAREALCRAPVYGIALVELIWSQLGRGSYKGAWIPAAAIGRPMHRFAFVGGVLHVRQAVGKPLPAPPGKFILHRWCTQDSPWGESILDSIYWLHYAKVELLKQMVSHLARFGSPPALIEYRHMGGTSEAAAKHNQAEVALAMEVLNTLQAESSVAIPEGLKLRLLEAQQAGNANFGGAIDLLEKAETLAVLGEVDTSGGNSATGSYSSYSVARDLLLGKVSKLAHGVETSINDHLLAPLVHYQFGPEAPVPRYKIHQIEAEDRGRRQEGILKARNLGLTVPEAYARLTFQVPKPRDGEPVIEPPQAEEANPFGGLFGSGAPAVHLASRTPSSQRPEEIGDWRSLVAVGRDASIHHAQRQMDLATAAFTAGRLAPDGDGLSWIVDQMDPTAHAKRLQVSAIHGIGLGIRRLLTDGVGEHQLLRPQLSGPSDQRLDLPLRPRRQVELAVDGGFRQLEDEDAAVAYWSRVLGVPKEQFDALSDAQRRYAFSVAGINDVRAVSDIQALAQRALAEGWVLDRWRQELEAVYAARGFTKTSDRHADLIHWNALRQSNGAYVHEQIIGNPATRSLIPYLRLVTMGDNRVRERAEHNHQIVEGLIFAADHPFWQAWGFPPYGFKCRCDAESVHVREAQRLGLQGSEPTGSWPIDPLTGSPALPDPGFRGRITLQQAAAETETTLRRSVSSQSEGAPGGFLAALRMLVNSLFGTSFSDYGGQVYA